MAKVKLTLDTRYKKTSGKFPVCLQVSHGVKTRYIQLGLDLAPEQWDSKKNEVKAIAKAPRITANLMYQYGKAHKYIVEHELEIKQYDIDTLKRALEVEIKKTEFTSQSTIDKAMVVRNNNGTLANWGQVLVDRAKIEKRIGTANWYKFGIDEFIRFNKGKDLALTDIDESFLEEFKIWAAMEIEGVKIAWKPNSIGNAMRAVRSILNKAISEKKPFITAAHQPFKSVKTPNETIEVNSINKTDIQNLRNLSLSPDSKEWKVRAMFLFMYNCQGMNFTDLAQLKVSDYQDGIILYYRAKTFHTKQRKRIEVYLTQEAKAIWDYFTKDKGKNDYAFNILHISQEEHDSIPPQLLAYNQKNQSKNIAVTQKNRIQRLLKTQNEILGNLSEQIGSRVKITTYDARYGWVNSALEAGISEELIGKGLGHQNLVVTRRYFEEKHKKSSLGNLNELITG